MKVIGYLRVSTEGQADNGCSLDAQRAKLEDYARCYDHELVGVEVDHASAKSLDRPGLQRALRMLGHQADGLLIAKLDRLTRRVRDLGELIEHYFERWSLLSVADHIDTTTPQGRLMLNILASVSQWERETISTRTKEALAFKKAQRERTGGVPYGYRLAKDGVHLERFETEQAMIERAKALRAEGLSLRQIGERLATEGYFPRRGKAWHPETISNLLRAGDDQAFEGRA